MCPICRIEGPLPYGSILGAGSEEEGDFDSMFVGWPNVLEVRRSCQHCTTYIHTITIHTTPYICLQVGREYRMYYHSFDARRGEAV